jgi:exopolyphosphatase/guanosine-5'-triphosphate,3'-diphosphate pyrophosphatase
LRDRLIKVLPAALRGDVIKATAILRVARALNQGRRGAVDSLRATARDGELLVRLKKHGRLGVDLEIWAAEKEVGYFREVFGRELSLRLA